MAFGGYRLETIVARCPACKRESIHDRVMGQMVVARDFDRLRCIHCGAWFWRKWRWSVVWFPVLLIVASAVLLLTRNISAYWTVGTALIAFLTIAFGQRYLLRSVLVPPTGCAKCHYDLRGIESDKCPECGTAKTGA